MQNLTAIPIIPTKNDVPEILEDGPNGALITQKINQLVDKSFRPFNTLDDNTAPYERYLDTVNGSDDNNGLTANTAYKTWDKAIQDFKVGMITDNWSTYLYIRGELQAPLDLRGIYGFSSSSYNNGTLTLAKFPDDDLNWTFKGVEEADGEYLSKLVFITDSVAVNVAIQNATLVLTGQMEFHKLNTEIAGCTFLSTANTNYFAVIFGEGTHYLQSNTYDYTLNHFRLRANGINCLLYGRGLSTFINPPPSQFEFAQFDESCRIHWTGSGAGSSVGVMSLGDCHAFWGTDTNWLMQVQTEGDLQWIDFSSRIKSLILTFPELTNGRHKIWFPPFKCRLYSYLLSANEGDATLQMDIGIGFLRGNPITKTFTSANDEIIDHLNIDFPPNAWRMFLNVTGSTVPLKNVHLQLNYGDI